ncbi:hypothetical protein [Microbacterium immunditiarum]|uniref:ABC-2 type transport system permease protein n=1 Tax=Microbacterium immunditiarum TaxID=337480 RepID=A0A7Y9KLY1_9MICO|nr:ABC-2 type transport system permease protein [Microbacterium immunditiarum]
MVATVLRLRYRVLGNTLARRPWQLVGFCIGLLWALWALVAVVAGLIALSTLQGLDVARAVAVLAGSALILGWSLGPVLVAGTESTVDARRLAPFPLTTRQIMLALAATGLTGIPGIASSIAGLATVVLWLRWPAAAAIALPSAALGVLTCVVASRLVTTLSSGLGGHRRGREIFGTIVLGIVIMTGPIITGIIALLDAAGDVLGRFAQAAAVLGWTPIGAAWAVPGDAAAGDWLTALAKFVIAGATLVVLWLLWARALEASVTAPPRETARTVAPGRLGFFSVMPTGGIGATWARSLTAWLRDPRYLRQLIFVPLFPVLFAFTTGLDGWLFTASPLMVALILSIAGYADISYDGTAFASVLSTGVSGRADRWGRLVGAASVGVPAVIFVSTVTTAIAGTWGQLPAVLAAALAILLGGYGVSAVSSALIVVPVPAAGDSPFKTVPGQTFVNGLLVFLVLGLTIALSAPAIVLAIVSTLMSSALLGWIALVVALVVGAGIIVGGVLVGGRTLERTGPDLLARIKAFPS